MHIIEPQHLRRGSERSLQSATAIRFGPIDFSLPFIHEHFTQLYFTPFYRELTEAQRLRYNQLSGIRSNEQFILFEHGFTRQVIARLATLPQVTAQPDLLACLALMLKEEEAHEAMFDPLNRDCAPLLYRHGHPCFTRLSRLEHVALWLITRIRQQFVFLVWLILILEEHSTLLSISMRERPMTESLGPLEPNMIKAHTVHLKDEARHVHIDANLIDLLLERTPPLWRATNAILFRRLLAEILTPKRAGIRVIRHLAQEFPSLRTNEESMIAAVRAQGLDQSMLAVLTDEQAMPVTTLMLEKYPEFAYAPGNRLRPHRGMS